MGKLTISTGPFLISYVKLPEATYLSLSLYLGSIGSIGTPRLHVAEQGEHLGAFLAPDFTINVGSLGLYF